MKLFLYGFFLFSFCSLQGQVFSAIVLDSLTKKPLDLATVTVESSHYSVFTDASGKFSIPDVQNNEKLNISYIGYESRNVILHKVAVGTAQLHFYCLMPKHEQLDAISIQSKKISYTGAKSIKSKDETAGYFSFQFGTENCTFISNPHKQNGKVAGIMLDLKKVKQHAKECRGCEVDYIAAYSIKFYSFDEANNRPGDEIYGRNLIIEPQNKSNTLKIDVDSLQIPFPENGICIGVETINTKYQNPKKAGAYIGPSVKFMELRQFPVKSWVRYRQEDWTFKSAATNADRKGKKYNGIGIGLIIKIENK